MADEQAPPADSLAVSSQHDLAAPGTRLDPGVIEQVFIGGDLARLTPAQRVEYYRAVCRSLGLNPLTRPFEYLRLNDKLTLYAKREATDQLRRLHGVSVQITSREQRDELCVVTARATMPDGRVDEATGAVSVSGLSATNLANALMKAECVPLESEILTRRGFRRYDALSFGEDVLAYDVGRDRTVWTPLQGISVYRSAPLVRLRDDAAPFEVTCTADHSWAVCGAGVDGGRRVTGGLVPAQQIGAGQRIVLAAPEMGSPGGCLTPGQAAALARAVTGDEVAAAVAGPADLPRVVAALSPAARRVVLDVLRRAQRAGRLISAGGDHGVLDAVQILCALEGRATAGFGDSRYADGARLRREPAGAGPVWCPTTAYGTWVMRQRGRVAITGNTKAKRRVTLSICGLGWLDESEMDGVPGARRVQVSDTGSIEDAPYLQKLRRRWLQLCADADALGVPHGTLPEDADEATIVRLGRVLRDAVQRARQDGRAA
jgi:hypothetical protein